MPARYCERTVWPGEAELLGHGAGLGILVETDDDVAAAVLEVEGVSVAL